MRSTTLAVVCLAFLTAGPLGALQADPQLPQFTDQQRWERLASGTVWWQAALIELGAEVGMTPEEVGTFAGEFFARGWLGGAEAGQFVVSMNRNHLSWPGAEVELLSSDPTTVEARFNRPWERWVGPDRQVGGVTSADFEATQRAATLAIADWVGVDVVWEGEKDADRLTLRTEYGPIRASNDLRWARGAYLSWNDGFHVLELQMATGMTPREIGLEAGRRYGPGWGSRTPWQLFRTMTWNAMTDPTTDCEVLSASPEEVRARCAINFAQRVEQGRNYFDITLEDVLENWRAFAESVAEQRGMRWEETWEDGYRVIRVTMR